MNTDKRKWFEIANWPSKLKMIFYNFYTRGRTTEANFTVIKVFFLTKNKKWNTLKLLSSALDNIDRHAQEAWEKKKYFPYIFSVIIKQDNIANERQSVHLVIAQLGGMHRWVQIQIKKLKNKI